MYAICQEGGAAANRGLPNGEIWRPNAWPTPVVMFKQKLFGDLVNHFLFADYDTLGLGFNEFLNRLLFLPDRLIQHHFTWKYFDASREVWVSWDKSSEYRPDIYLWELESSVLNQFQQ